MISKEHLTGMEKKVNPAAFVITLLLLNSAAFATDFASCRTVYDNIINAIGRLDPPAPAIVFRKSETLTAEIKPTGEIHVGDKFIATCRAMGKDSLNAMALVLGHELAHHFQNHFWAKQYGTAYADLAWGKKVSGSFKDIREMGVYESQADEFGMFYAFVAGYNTLGLSASLYEKIYRDYQLPENLAGYPSLSERKEIARLSEERVKKLIPVFEAGKLLSFLSITEKGENRQYLLGKASECFEKIIDEKFTSREIFNNLGVACLQMAIGMLDEEENKFAYPVLLDDDSRLYALKDESSAGTKGLGFSDQQMQALLEKAEKYFNHAKELDRNYLPAHINLACVADLRKEYEDAAYLAGKAFKLAGERGKAKMQAYALEIHAIALAHQNDKGGAEKKFSEAKAAGSALSDYNLAVLKEAEPSFAKLPGKFSLSKKEELVSGKSLYQLVSEAEYSNENLYKLRGDSRIIMLEKLQGDLFVVECTEAQCPYSNVVFFQTHADYGQPTSAGIKKGDSLEKIISAYGKPSQVAPSGAGDYYVFSETSIIFKIVNGKAEGWTIYFRM